MSLTDLAEACRKSGLRVVELPGWRTRGRPASTGGFDPMGVLCHHTAGASNSRDYVEWMAHTGRPDEGLPAPLVQLALDRQGTVYVCAAGRANHAGASGGSGPIPVGDGNALLIGIEAMNSGSEGWTATQYDAYVRLAAALCLHYGWPASHVRAHKETSVTGKVDPSGSTPHGPAFDMDRFRADVARLLRNGIERDWLDMATEKEVRSIVREEVAELLGLDVYPGDDKAVTLAEATRRAASAHFVKGQIDDVRDDLAKVLAAVKGQTA